MAHMTKHELKHDEMADVGEKMSAWYERHQKAINAVLAIVLVAIIGYKLYSRWHESQLASANIKYGTILMNYQSGFGQTDDAKRREMFNTAITEGDRFLDEYPRLKTTEAVQLLIGNAHYYLAASYASDANMAREERQKARDAFQKYLSMADTNQEKAVAQLALGNVIENQLFTEKTPDLQRDVLAAYDEAIRLGAGTYVEAEAKMAKGRMMTALQGRQDEAKLLFEAVATARKVESEKPAETPKPTRELTSEEKLAEENAAKITKFFEMSYATAAEKELNRMKGLRTSK